MSYDVSFNQVQMTEVASYNYTSNCGPMFRLALGGNGLRDLDGQPAYEVVDRLRAAVVHMRAPENAATYEAMNPPNGWGRHSTATDFLARLLQEAEAYPQSVIRVSS